MTSPNTDDSPEFGDTIVEVSRDRKTIVVNLAGKEYTATKPRKTEEWFAEIQMAISSDESGAALAKTDQFIGKILGEDGIKDIRRRRLDDDDDLTWNDLSNLLLDVLEVWTTEPDQPVRPTGRPSASGRGRKPTTRK